MARSKKHLYPVQDQLLCESLKTIDHPARLRILRFLLEKGSSCVSDIAQQHPLSNETISGHLNNLFKHDLLTYQERYPYSFYTVHQENLVKTLQQLINCCVVLLELAHHPSPHEYSQHPSPDQ